MLIKNIKKIFQRKVLEIEAVCLTHLGNIRSKNEDNYYFNSFFLPLEHTEEMQIHKWIFSTEQIQCMGIFDGMGGECAGDLASYTAVKKFHELYASSIRNQQVLQQERITEALIKISDAVHAAAVAQRYKLIGTTATLFFIKQKKGVIANLGDSPMYCLRNAELRLLTHAHTNAELLKQQNIRRKPGLTQFLGINSKEFILEPYIADVQLMQDDQYLICSDGLTDMVSEERIQKILESSMDIEDKCMQLRDEALQNGGRDNITIILCQVK